MNYLIIIEPVYWVGILQGDGAEFAENHKFEEKFKQPYCSNSQQFMTQQRLEISISGVYRMGKKEP